jgi:putative ABC transport system substrate-binding protein
LDRYAALANGLRDLGYIDGETIAIDRRLSQDQTGATFVPWATDLVARSVQVIVTSSTPALVAAAAATTSVPIICAGPNRGLIDLGLANSIARPGRNITGIETDPLLAGKGVELLHDIVPRLARAGYLRNVATPGTVDQFQRAQQTGRALGVELIDLPSRQPDDIDMAFANAANGGLGGMVIAGDFLFGDPSQWRVINLAAQYRLPAVYTQTAGYTDQGGLLAYAPDYNAFHQRAATFVSKVLHGTRAADLPIELAMTFELVINLSTAHSLGLSIPESVLLQAATFIE